MRKRTGIWFDSLAFVACSVGVRATFEAFWGTLFGVLMNAFPYEGWKAGAALLALAALNVVCFAAMWNCFSNMVRAVIDEHNGN